MTISRNRLAFAVMAATAGLAQANEPQEPAAAVLKQVTVTATRVEKEVGETAHAIDVVDQYEIQQNQPESVAQAVKTFRMSLLPAVPGRQPKVSTSAESRAHEFFRSPTVHDRISTMVIVAPTSQILNY